MTQTGTMITINGETTEVAKGQHIYCTHPDTFIEWEDLSATEQGTMAVLMEQHVRATNAINAEIASIIIRRQQEEVVYH